MKTILISLLAVLLFNINLVSANDKENTKNTSGMKQTIAFRLTPGEVSKTAASIETGELERTDIAKIAFRINIHKVTESAIRTDERELTNRPQIAFRINVKQVVENLDLNQAMSELAAPEIAFSLQIKNVVENLAKADLLDLLTKTSPVAFNLNIHEVTKFADTVDVNELCTEDSFLAHSK
jgi:hypothetical protein